MPDSHGWLSLFYLEMVWSHEEEGGGAICTEWERCPILEWKDLAWHINAASLTPHVGG